VCPPDTIHTLLQDHQRLHQVNVTHDAGDPEDPTRICEPSYARTGMATTGDDSPAGGLLVACCGPGADDGGGGQMLP